MNPNINMMPHATIKKRSFIGFNRVTFLFFIFLYKSSNTFFFFFLYGQNTCLNWHIIDFFFLNNSKYFIPNFCSFLYFIYIHSRIMHVQLNKKIIYKFKNIFFI